MTVEEAWARAIAELGGRVEGSSIDGTLAAVVDEIAISIDHSEVQHEGLWRYATRLSCMLAGAGPLRFSLTRGHVYALSKLLGVEDIEIDDELFDRDFIIKANDDEHLRLWLDRDTRRAIELTRDCAFRLEGGELSANLSGSRTSNPLAPLRALLAFRAREERLLDELGRIAIELGGELDTDDGWRVDGSTVLRVLTSGTAVEITPVVTELEPGEPLLWTRVSCRRLAGETIGLMLVDDTLVMRRTPGLKPVKRGNLPSLFPQRFRVLSSAPKDPVAELSPPTGALLNRSGALLVARDDSGTDVYLRSAELELEPLRAAVELAQRLSAQRGTAPRGGPYR